jgi:hypothetical protein
MRKKYLFLVICVLCIGCNKSSQQIDTNESIIASLETISNLSKDDLESYSAANRLTCNQYEIVSDLTSESVKEFYNIVLNNNEKGQDLSCVLTDLIKSKLPVEYTDFSGSELSELEKKIFNLINRSVYENSFESLDLRIKCIEDVISKSMAIDTDSKMRLLVYCAAVKGTIYTLEEIICSIKGETWEECFKKKIKAMGYIESVLCVVEWPACLGAKAADCLIETLF